MTGKRRWEIWVASVWVLWACACGGPGAEGGPPATSVEPEHAAIFAPADARFEEALMLLNTSGAALSAPLEDMFAPSFLAEVPAAELRPVFQQLSASGPFEVLEREAFDDEGVRAVVRSSAGSTLVIRLAVESEEPHLVRLFGIQAADYLNPDLPDSWEEIELALREQAAWVNLMAARVDAGVCSPVAEVDPDRRLAIGSAFKLWVLGALARAVAAGDSAWDETLPIDPAWRSISDLTLRELPDGEPLTLRRHAEEMISVSDNSATDHLIHYLGAERVEAAMAAMGHSEPGRNTPFLTTKQMMVIKLIWNAERRDHYVATDLDAQRAMLVEADEVAIGVLLWGAVGWSEPREIDRFEWFATPGELCAAMADLQGLAGTDTGVPVREILSINGGMGFDRERWTWIGFKGGSEPGVLNFTWLLRRDDDAWFVLTMSLNDPEQAIDLAAAIELAAAGINLLAEAE